ncbi:MAG TPA: type II toxin-antitoxin system HicB family antitoxin [Ignavibacteria bacterium]|nr:type II toxin-antitoxin system HicB family antitoxin [Ignavibacteria bacterium]HMR39153.1 type II toxin-antitoxin system HicB family antitoxin [Ignavibacteria bacterium]
MDYLAIIKKSGNGYSAYIPDIPGCIAAAKTKKETLELLEEALEIHLEDYSKMPKQKSEAAIINVA